MKILPKFLSFSILSIFIFLAPLSSASLVINEILANPVDEQNEWIEIYNEGNIWINISNLLVGDLYSNDTLASNFSDNINSTYFLIVGENANVSQIVGNETIIYFRTTSSKIGNGLRNSGENVSLYDIYSGRVSRTSYPDFSDNEGHSWARMENGSWFYCNEPTPGFPNVCPGGPKNETTNQTNGNTTVGPANETNQTDDNKTMENTCDVSVSISARPVFDAGETNIYHIELADEECSVETKNVTIEYRIVDFFGGYERKPYTTVKGMGCLKNIPRQWTPGDARGTEAFYLVANITGTTCNDSDASNDRAEKLVVVKGTAPCSECSPKEDGSGSSGGSSCPPCPSCPDCAPGVRCPHLRIISFPREIERGREFETLLLVDNARQEGKNYSVYSYVFSGKELISLGFNGKSWEGGWKANEVNVTVSGNSTALVSLKNMIPKEKNATEGRLRVRVLEGGRKRDLTKEVGINDPRAEPDLEAGNFAERATGETRGKDKDSGNASGASFKIPTGRAVSGDGNVLTELANGVIDFFKMILNL